MTERTVPPDVDGRDETIVAEFVELDGETLGSAASGTTTRCRDPEVGDRIRPRRRAETESARRPTGLTAGSAEPSSTTAPGRRSSVPRHEPHTTVRDRRNIANPSLHRTHTSAGMASEPAGYRVDTAISCAVLPRIAV